MKLSRNWAFLTVMAVLTIATMAGVRGETCGKAGEVATASDTEPERCTPGRCAAFGACSLRGNLAFAEGETLEMYFREKAEDGRELSGVKLPDFTALKFEGRPVRSEQLRGQSTILFLMAGHCQHSHDSIPIVSHLAQAYRSQGVRVVAAVVNSGDAAEVKTWMPGYHPAFETWVVNDVSLGDTLGAHLVPSYLFVSAEGQPLGKLVGQKTRGEVTRWVEQHLPESS